MLFQCHLRGTPLRGKKEYRHILFMRDWTEPLFKIIGLTCIRIQLLTTECFHVLITVL